MSDTRQRIRHAAMNYAGIGWPVFPLRPIVGDHCACGGTACAGKHPASKGWQRTIASVQAAESLWADRHGARGIGLLCGPQAGVFGVDVDSRHGGAQTMRELKERHGPLPPTIISRTGGGGWHLIFAWPVGGEQIPSRANVAAGVDIRGTGGFLVLPPSPHASGQGYAWITRPGDLEPAQAPDWLLELVRHERRGTAQTGAGGERALVPVGRRHDELVSFCGSVRSAGVREQTLVECGHAFLRHEVQHDPAKPLDLEHAERTMRGVAHRYPPQPNRKPGGPVRRAATPGRYELATLRAIPSAEYVPLLTGREVNEAGFVRCPWHAEGRERTPSLRVRPDDGRWFCPACGKGGGLFEFYAKLHNRSVPAGGAAFLELAHEVLAAVNA